jgi:transcriptional regulator with XRE-family HTH domain
MQIIVYSTVPVPPPINHIATGANVRALRLKKGVCLREVARRLGWSAAYVSDLELGRRGWTVQRVDKVVGAIEVAQSNARL